MTIANWLYQTALSWPNRPALYEGDVLRQTYADLLQATCNRAAWLRTEHGVQAGDRVAVFAKNAPEYIEALHACWWIGAVVVPINCKLHPREAEWIIRDSEAALVITQSGTLFAEQADIHEAALCMPVRQNEKLTPLRRFQIKISLGCSTLQARQEPQRGDAKPWECASDDALLRLGRRCRAPQ
ncbi:AMP-binding protein [Celeribacter baekdonensis]|uniref:AMP-binding protein n=1 Tax=Celeribacter baekdonensis TaxID=875171 RepID=UPI003F6CEC19